MGDFPSFHTVSAAGAPVTDRPGSKGTRRSASKADVVLPKLHSVSEVAEMFGRQPRTIRSWMDAGLLPRVKVGNAVFIPAEALANMVADAVAKAAKKPSRAKVSKRTSKNTP